MKKKANIPATILAIGVFVICIIAVISFILAKVHTRDDFLGIKLMEKINSQIEKYSFNQNLNEADIKKLDSGEIVFYQEMKKTTGFLFWEEEKVVFSVEYPVG